MLESTITTTYQLLDNDSSLNFQNVTRRSAKANCCGWIDYTPGSSIFSILRGGAYRISFSGSISSATAGPVAIGLYKNGELIPSTIRAVTLGAGSVASVSFEEDVYLCGNVGADFTIRSVPSVVILQGATATPTEVPTIVSASVIVNKES